MDNFIAAYIHCKQCIKEKRDGKIAVGFTPDGAAVQVWCELHDAHVALLPLSEPVRNLLCGECGQPLGEGHQHKH